MQARKTIDNEIVNDLYRNYVLVMLTLVYVFNFIDRQLLVILQESIKKELDLSDTQLGVLSGFTFALFYVTLGIPIARFADKTNRRNIVAASLALWSLMTASRAWYGISANCSWPGLAWALGRQVAVRRPMP